MGCLIVIMFVLFLINPALGMLGLLLLAIVIVSQE